MIVPQPCGDTCQIRCQSADAHTCEVTVPGLQERIAAKAAGGKFPGAKCYQKCLWNCVRGCFSQISPAAARAEAEHWNSTVSELSQWKQEALKEYSVVEAEYVNGKKASADHIDNNGLEKKVEKLRDIMEYVDALKASAKVEQKRSEKLALLGDRAEEAETA